MSHLRLRPAVVVGALLALAGSANAFAAGNLVVSQIYGGGGSGASYTHDFIEVFNRGTVSEPLAGFSLQYASAIAVIQRRQAVQWRLRAPPRTIRVPASQATRKAQSRLDQPAGDGA